MPTETVKLHGGNADGRWHKVERGSTTTECRGTEYAKTELGRWEAITEQAAAAAPEVEADVEAPKPAPRKRRTSKPKAE